MNHSPRRHRRRFSAVRASTDTTNTLPEYSWRTDIHNHHPTQLNDPLPSDRPPDYPDSAEEADADTDSPSDHSSNPHDVGRHSNSVTYVPQPYSPAALPSPSRVRRPPALHRRHSSIPKPRKSPNRGDREREREGAERDQLDTLLERSVHALEMSNVLLQSSMSTQKSLSEVLSPESPAESRLLHRARSLQSRIRGTRAVHANWADDLEVIKRGVEGLFTEDRRNSLKETSDSEDGGSLASSRGGRTYASASSSHSHQTRAQKIRRSREPSDSISSSLPTASNSTYVANGYHRPPSLDLRQASSHSQRKYLIEPESPLAQHSTLNVNHEYDLDADADAPQLRLSPKDRRQLVARAPRALTQYVESGEDPGLIRLPSTLGLRATSSNYSATSSPFASPSRQPSGLSSVPMSPDPDFSSRPTPNDIYSIPTAKSASTSFLPLVSVTDKLPEPSTRAYAMLSSFVYRPPPTPPTSTPSSFMTTSFISTALARRGSKSGLAISAGDKGRLRSSSVGSPSKVVNANSSTMANGSVHSTLPRSRSTTPKPLYQPSSIQRRMTPPIEELSSSSASDGPVAKQTVVSLRKILNDQPPPRPKTPSPTRQRLRAPAFNPISPQPVAAAVTSTATASISRLFTKGTHSSSTRPPSPPRVSSLKHSPNSSNSSRASTPALLSPSLAPAASGSVSGGSGRNTPKRISFAELPESYSGSSGTGTGFNRVRQRSRRSGAKGKGRASDGEGDAAGKSKWWSTWLLGGNTNGNTSSGGGASTRSPYEDGMGMGVGTGTLARSFGPRMGIGGGLDEWGV